MTDEQTKAKPVTGRTVWDYVTRISKDFGLPIVILVVIGYGIFMFQQQAMQYQSQLNKANQAVTETYVAIGTMNKTALQNIRESLDMHQTLQARLKELQQKAMAETQKADEAVAKCQKAQEDEKQAREQVKELKAEHEQMKKDSAAKSGPFKEDVKALVTLLTSEQRIDMDEIGTLAAQIRVEHLVDPNKLLEAVANDPSIKNLQKLNELEGLKVNTMMNIATKNDANFDGWVSFVEEPDMVRGLLGAVIISDDQVKTSIFMLTDEDRVFLVETTKRLFVVSFPSPNDWDSNLMVMASEELDGDFFYDTVPAGEIADLTTDEFPLSRLLLIDILTTKVLAGKEPRLKPVSLDNLREKDLTAYNKLITSEDTAALAARMIRNSETFSATTILPITMGQRYPDLGNLRETIIQALNAAVRRDNKQRQALAAKDFSQSNWGLLAAAALTSEFTFRNLFLSSDGREASAVFSVRRQDLPGLRTARLTLARPEPNAQAKWKLTGFVKTIREETTQSLIRQMEMINEELRELR